MSRNNHGTRSELIRCDNCGEEYSATYKRCPFCGSRPDKSAYTQTGSTDSADDGYVFDGQDVFDDPDEDDGYGVRRGGKHLAGDGLALSPTTIAGILFSAVIVIAAILIVVLVILPMVNGGQTISSPNPSGSTDPGTVSTFTPGPEVTDSPAPTTDPSNTPAPPTSSVSPSPSVSTGRLTITYRDEKRTEFTISDVYPHPVQLSTTGGTGTVTWSSSNPSVATVSSTGLVTGVSKGNATITATDANGNKQTCAVSVTLTSAAAPSSSPSASPSPAASSLALNKTDITISDAYPDPVTLKATGASGTVTWTSSKPDVATVDANGKVTRVGKGTATITATDADGNTAKCTVRCS